MADAGERASISNAKTNQDTQTSERDRLRVSLLESNAKVWFDGPSPPSGALDASLKRNSTFIKRVRQGNIGDAKEQLLRDIDTLNLGKYLDELVPSLPELLWRSTTVKDRLSAIELISALHQRYGTEDFTVPLTEAVGAQLLPSNHSVLQELSVEQREKDESVRITRQRVLLRGATELALTGLAGSKVYELGVQGVTAMGHSWLLGVLHQLVCRLLMQFAQDRDHANVSLAVHVLKSFSTHLLAPVLEHEAGEAVSASETENTMLVSVATKMRFRKLFETYFITLSKRILRDHSVCVYG